MSNNVEDLRAILAAYNQVTQASWPELHPTMAAASSKWAGASAADLTSELANWVRDASRATSGVRLFWKVGPQFEFGGCNMQFANDAGLNNPTELVGATDFDARLPWRPQAAKYRMDDESVVKSKTSQLGIIERQKGADGSITWVRVGKVPIVRADGTAIGVLGMYEQLDPAEGRRLALEQPKRPGQRPEAGQA
jgi:hypothetical protein